MASAGSTVHSPPTSRRRAFPQLGQRRFVASRSGSSGALIADSTRDPQFGQASCSLLKSGVVTPFRNVAPAFSLAYETATPLLEATIESHDSSGGLLRSLGCAARSDSYRSRTRRWPRDCAADSVGSTGLGSHSSRARLGCALGRRFYWGSWKVPCFPVALQVISRQGTLRGLREGYGQRPRHHRSPLIWLRPGAARSERSGGRRELSLSEGTSSPGTQRGAVRRPGAPARGP